MRSELPPFVQELFEEGRDPLADPRTDAWLLEHPEALAAFVELRATLQALPAPNLPTAQPAPSSPRSPIRWPIGWPMLAAAAAAIVVFGSFAVFTSGAAMEPEEPTPPVVAARAPLTRPDFPTTSRVVTCRTVATKTRGRTSHRRIVVRLLPGAERHENIRHHDDRRAAAESPRLRVRVRTSQLEGQLP